MLEYKKKQKKQKTDEMRRVAVAVDSRIDRFSGDCSVLKAIFPPLIIQKKNKWLI